MLAYIGRQAIYNTVYNVAGYELLYRRNEQIGAAGLDMDGDEMTKSVLLDAVNVFGIKNLTNGLPAYINFTRNLIMDDFAYLFDPSDIVVEVPSEIFVNDALVSKLSSLQRAGYQLSLNSYNEKNGRIKFDRIINSFDVIRLNIAGKNRLQVKDLLQRLRFSRTQLLAERVETESEFEMVQALKFTLFQGYYFERPDTVSKQVSLTATPYGKLLAELMKPHPNFEMCCRIVESDGMLSHLFLRRALKARYNRENVAAEIRRGMTLMGLDGLRQWTAAQFLKQVNTTASDELARKAFLRGRFVERLVQKSETSIAKEQGFFLGLISLLDQVTGATLESILTELTLPEEAAAALLGKQENEYSAFLQYAMVYEMASGTAQFPNIKLRLGDRRVSNLYMECMADTDRAFAEVLEE
ncbi:MAG: EAL domain-containing protein [Oscillospiraceae bacterium]|nr:EAL domain-containing protein [Oscillospiraceae bacterium]MBQ9719800.1 EAL domain-containing protein [Oscillospiraceae bacterium]